MNIEKITELAHEDCSISMFLEAWENKRIGSEELVFHVEQVLENKSNTLVIKPYIPVLSSITIADGRETMADEVLYIPEENLAEVILVIRRGLEESKRNGGLSEEVIKNLERWCDEEEEYLQAE